MSTNAPTIETLDLAEIKPYFRNPRENKLAVEKVKQSIEKYGYNQLIAVDRQHVIIAGHTRYHALTALAWGKVPVLVLDLTEQQAKAYRIVDNKTAEFAKWTPDLAVELRDLGDALPDIQSFFQDDLGVLLAQQTGRSAEGVSAEELRSVENRLGSRFQDAAAKTKKEIICGHCGKSFFVTK